MRVSVCVCARVCACVCMCVCVCVRVCGIYNGAGFFYYKPFFTNLRAFNVESKVTCTHYNQINATFNTLKFSGYFMYHRITIPSFYILPSENTYVFLKSLRLLTNESLKDLSQTETLCSLWRRNLIKLYIWARSIKRNPQHRRFC